MPLTHELAQVARAPTGYVAHCCCRWSSGVRMTARQAVDQQAAHALPEPYPHIPLQWNAKNAPPPARGR